MFERLPVEVVFFGEPFDRDAIIHTLRHLAMRIGWTFRPRAERRIIYATTENPLEIPVREGDLVILSSHDVKKHMTESRAGIPLRGENAERFPFYHPKANDIHQRGWIKADVIAGAHALFNLLYERKNRPEKRDGWMRFTEDWWTAAGFARPEPLSDFWLNSIAFEAEKIGWPRAERQGEDAVSLAPGTVVLTHDVDYMPTRANRGMPRFLRAVLRQLLTRRSAGQAWQIMSKYRKAFFQPVPYNALKSIADEETILGAISSFQFTVKRRHRSDPVYDLRRYYNTEDDLRNLLHRRFEICLHGSYRAGRTPGQLAGEKIELESILGMSVSGHRQHYLNFHPATFFPELERAGLEYDMSVGYNDMSGPRAGTLFPFRPYDMEKAKPFSLWEIPFILMDTTLATTYRFSSGEALDHCIDQIRPVEKSGGCVSLIWHQEQLSGLLDPGFDRIYWILLKKLKERGIRLTSGRVVVEEIAALWNQTIGD
ncbi:MAG: polysaccharide deacetylase family protein [Syntrophales bacterium]